MTPERWEKIDQLFQAARQRDPSSRAAYLAEACQHDEDLRRFVESLLLHDERQSKLGEGLSWAPVDISLPVGTELGPYRVGEKLGEGFMGVVFCALDRRLGRSVAIKVVRAQFSDRFQREAQIIAALNHPHICTLHDVGPNFLVMELLEGPSRRKAS